MAEQPKSDPRYRPFRAAAWALYLSVTIAFSMLVTVSVMLAVGRQAPQRPKLAVSMDADQCLGQARALFDELENRRKLMPLAKPERLEAEWSEFRLRWLTQKREAEAKCGVDEPGREQVHDVYARLEVLVDAYATHVTQFSSQVAPDLAAFEAAASKR